MRLPTAQLVLLAGVCLSGLACGEHGPPRKETYPVTGQVYVDGAPTNYLAVTCHDTKGMDAAMPTVSSAFTGQDGGFSISTYESGDGVPAGDYVLTFMWGQRGILRPLRRLLNWATVTRTRKIRRKSASRSKPMLTDLEPDRPDHEVGTSATGAGRQADSRGRRAVPVQPPVSPPPCGMPLADQLHFNRSPRQSPPDR